MTKLKYAITTDGNYIKVFIAGYIRRFLNVMSVKQNIYDKGH